MKEIVVISGKGGTGKTSVTASFAALAGGNAVVADCDVDAADLHLILKPRIRRRAEFRSGHVAFIRSEQCTNCGKCAGVCRFEAVRGGADGQGYSIDGVACEGCGVCVRFCPAKAIGFREEVCGEWFVSETRFGTMVHARLGIAAENSGKLVTLVRNEAKRIGQEGQVGYVLVDGSPGIGCPVIASLTAADLALIVTEPTVSGEHDLRRIAGLAKRLRVPAMMCVNKWDINPEATEAIESYARGEGIALAGRVRYDTASTAAQRRELTVTEYCGTGIANDIRNVWGALIATIEAE